MPLGIWEASIHLENAFPLCLLADTSGNGLISQQGQQYTSSILAPTLS
jgi:hypothetical protein